LASIKFAEDLIKALSILIYDAVAAVIVGEIFEANYLVSIKMIGGKVPAFVTIRVQIYVPGNYPLLMVELTDAIFKEIRLSAIQ